MTLKSLVILIAFSGLLVSGVTAQRIVRLETYQVTEDGLSNYPCWDPGGDRLFFCTDNSNQTTRDNSNWTLRSYSLVTEIFEDYHVIGTSLFPNVSHDGQKIAYVNIVENKEASLWCLNLSQNTSERILAPTLGGIGDFYPPGPNTRPSWNPDDSLIFHSGYLASEETWVLWAASLDGNQDQITRSINRSIKNFDVDVAVSPDGSRLAFHSQRSGSNEIWVSNIDGSNPLQLTFSNDSQTINMEPCWSPDGKYIAFASDRNGNFDIWYMKADGSEQSALTATPYAETCPSWSKQNRIAYCKNINGHYDIWVSEVSYDNCFIRPEVPSELVLDWNNSIGIFVRNGDNYDYNYTLKAYGSAIQGNVVYDNISVSAGNASEELFDIVPHEEGSRTLVVEIYKGENYIFRKYYEVQIKAPAVVVTQPQNMQRKIIKGNPITMRLTIYNVANTSAKGIELILSGDLANYAKLSNPITANLEPSNAVDVEISVDIPNAERLSDTISGELRVHGRNFEDVTVPISILLVAEDIWGPQFWRDVIIVSLAAIGTLIATSVGAMISTRKSKKERSVAKKNDEDSPIDRIEEKRKAS
jgi:Tol biopolymer transport system component